MSFNNTSDASDNYSDFQFDGIAEEEPKKAEQPAKPEKPKREPKRNQKPKQPEQKDKKERSIKQVFNPKLLTHSLNSFYDDFKFKDFSAIKDNKTQGKVIIDIANYSALDEFKRAVESEEENENRTSIKLKDADKWDAITHGIWNFKLRGILTAINDNHMKKKQDDGSVDTSLFTNHIVNQLEFTDIEKFEPTEIAGNIAEFFTSDKLKFKLYNAMFPHPSISQKKDNSEKGEHLNKVYLQNISKYHDEYLKMMYTGKGKTSAQDLFKFACGKIAKDVTISKSLTAEKLFNADYKKLNESFTKDERNECDEIIKAAKYEKVVSERYHRCYSLAMEQGLMDTKKNKAMYAEYMNTIEHFKELSKNVMAADVSTIERFIDVLIDAFREADKRIHYKGAIKNFIKDIDCVKKLVFTQRFKQVLTRLIAEDKTVSIKYSGSTFNAKFIKKTGEEGELAGDVIQEAKHTFNNVYDALAKVGLFVGNRVRKDIRVGIGIAIIDYIINEARNSCPKPKKARTDKQQRKIIYIKA